MTWQKSHFLEKTKIFSVWRFNTQTDLTLNNPISKQLAPPRYNVITDVCLKLVNSTVKKSNFITFCRFRFRFRFRSTQPMKLFHSGRENIFFRYSQITFQSIVPSHATITMASWDGKVFTIGEILWSLPSKLKIRHVSSLSSRCY